MANQKRKLQRKKKKQQQKEAKQKLAKKTGLYLQIPDKCGACSAPFDKKNKEMAFTWKVAVYEEEEKVYLFCPVCYNKKSKEKQDNV